MGSKILKTGYYLPENILSNEDLGEMFADFDSIKIGKKIGVKNRHIASKDETVLDLAYQAASNLLNDTDKQEIDFVLFCTQSPDYKLPTTACILQDKLGLRKSVGALDFNLGCSGYVYGLSVAKGLIAGGIAKCVLLVVAETYSKYLHPKDKANRSIFGDGAACSLIQKSEEDGIGEFVLGTDGAGHGNLIVKNGGSKTHFNPIVEDYEYGTGNFSNDNCLFMNGPEIFNFTIENIPSTISSCLEKNGLTIDDVDMFIYHQANKFMINYLRKLQKIPKSKCYVNLEETGNTVSPSIPIALSQCLEQSLIKKGDKVLIVGFGVGLSLAATVITI